MYESESWKQYLNEYISENFIFGVRYLAMRQITKAEKVWWFLWIGASLAACIFSMFTMYGKWDANPVAIVYGSELMPVSTIPFPAITICPLSKSRSDKFNLTWALQALNHNFTLDADSKKKLRAMAHVCPFQKHWKKFTEPAEENTVEALRSMTHPLEQVIVSCWWRSKSIACNKIFKERLVDDGICYTFNSLAPDELYREDQISPDFLSFSNDTPPSDWNREDGYQSGSILNAYPYRPLSNGIISGVILAIVSKRADQETMCMGTHTGFKFSVHAPDAVPLTEDRFFRLNNMSAAIVSISPEVYRASEVLRTIDPVKRNCYFTDERPLKFFQLYNQINCIIECIANYTLSKCGCVNFAMPRSAGTNICDASMIDCYRNSIMLLFEIAVRAKLAGSKNEGCRCMPACNSVDYTVGLTKIPLNHFPLKLHFMRDDIDPALMFISLRDMHYFPILRRELVGVNQAVAQLGGLFALLMGSSMLSLAEIVYYCCVRRLRRTGPPRPRDQAGADRPRSRGHRIHLRVNPWAKQPELSIGRFYADRGHNG